jgi:PAT family beta-lactamase induction signal transducer AmpG
VFGALWVSGVLQLVSNLVFVVQADLGANAGFLAVTIGFENLSGGLGTAAFVAYLSGLCDRRYTATQYALLTAVSSTLQTVLSTPTGSVVAIVGWGSFYMGTAVAALPALLVLAYVQKHATQGASASEPDSSADSDSRNSGS